MMLAEYMSIYFTKRFSKMENEAENQAIAMHRGEELAPHIKPMVMDELSDDAEETVYKQGSNNQNSVMKSSKEKALAPLQIPEINDIQADYNILNSDSRKLLRLQILNTKLISELADAKLSEERYIRDYENERKKCKMLKRRCDKLEEQLSSNETELDYFEKESEDVSEEVDRLEAEVSKQRGAMYTKLEDAEEILENKYMELEHLCSQLKAFLRKNCDGEPAEAVNEAKVIVQAVSEVEVICEDHEMILKKLPRVRIQAYSEDDLSDFDT